MDIPSRGEQPKFDTSIDREIAFIYRFLGPIGFTVVLSRNRKYEGIKNHLNNSYNNIGIYIILMRRIYPFAKVNFIEKLIKDRDDIAVLDFIEELLKSAVKYNDRYDTLISMLNKQLLKFKDNKNFQKAFRSKFSDYKKHYDSLKNEQRETFKYNFSGIFDKFDWINTEELFPPKRDYARIAPAPPSTENTTAFRRRTAFTTTRSSSPKISSPKISSTKRSPTFIPQDAALLPGAVEQVTEGGKKTVKEAKKKNIKAKSRVNKNS